jgi:hypothetical protein
MATLKRYNSKQQLSTKGTRTITDVEGAKMGGKSLEKIGKQGQEIATTWQNAINSTTLTQKENSVHKGTSDILIDAETDYESKNYETNIQKLEELKTTGLTGWSDNTAREAYEPDLNYKITEARIKLDAIYQKHLVTTKNAARKYQRSDNYTEYINTGDQKWIDKEIKETNKALEDKFIDPETAADENIKAKGWKEERETKLKTKDSILRREIRANQVINELGLVDKLINSGPDGISNEEVINAAGKADNEDGDIGNDFGMALMGYKNNPGVYADAKRKNKLFDASIKALLDSKDKDNVSKVLTDILKDKKLKMAELTVLMGVAKAKHDTLYGVIEESGDDPKAKKEHKKLLHALYGWITGKNKDTDESTEGIKEIIADVENGVDAEEALKNAEARAVLKRYPVMATYPKEGKIITDPESGISMRYFPNGRSEEVK